MDGLSVGGPVNDASVGGPVTVPQWVVSLCFIWRITQMARF